MRQPYTRYAQQPSPNLINVPVIIPYHATWRAFDDVARGACATSVTAPRTRTPPVPHRSPFSPRSCRVSCGVPALGASIRGTNKPPESPHSPARHCFIASPCRHHRSCPATITSRPIMRHTSSSLGTASLLSVLLLLLVALLGVSHSAYGNAAAFQPLIRYCGVPPSKLPPPPPTLPDLPDGASVSLRQVIALIRHGDRYVLAACHTRARSLPRSLGLHHAANLRVPHTQADTSIDVARSLGAARPRAPHNAGTTTLPCGTVL